MAKRTPTDDTTPADNKTLRCPAVEGAQQCLAARHGKMQNHRWGPRGETDQWHADGRPKDWFAPGHDSGPLPHENAAAGDVTLVTGNPDVLPAASPPGGGQAADPTPSAVPGAGASPEPSRADPRPALAGSGGGGSSRSLARRADDTEAAEEMVRAAMSVISQPAQADHAIRHSLELARVLKLAETAGSMFADLASGDLASEGDIRVVRDLAWRMAATRGVEP